MRQLCRELEIQEWLGQGFCSSSLGVHRHANRRESSHKRPVPWGEQRWTWTLKDKLEAARGRGTERACQDSGIACSKNRACEAVVCPGLVRPRIYGVHWWGWRLQGHRGQAVNRTAHFGETSWFHSIRTCVSFTAFRHSHLGFSLGRGLQGLLEKAHATAK